MLHFYDEKHTLRLESENLELAVLCLNTMNRA